MSLDKPEPTEDEIVSAFAAELDGDASPDVPTDRELLESMAADIAAVKVLIGQAVQQIEPVLASGPFKMLSKFL